MTEPQPPSGHRELGLVEYALIIALTAIVVIGVLAVLAPTISTIVKTIQNGG